MFAIGAISKKTGVTIRTLRYYKVKNLLKHSYVAEGGLSYKLIAVAVLAFWGQAVFSGFSFYLMTSIGEEMVASYRTRI